MMKSAFTALLAMTSALVQPSFAGMQVISDSVFANLYADYLLSSESLKLKNTEIIVLINPQRHLKEKLKNIDYDLFDVPSLIFKDNKNLSYVVSKSLLGKYSGHRIESTADKGFLHMNSDVKSLLEIDVINMMDIVEARSVVIKNGVVMLIGQ